MSESHNGADLSLPEFLSARARHASDARLAIDVAAGFVVGIAATFWRGRGWTIIASAALCFLAYGAWGIVDRELRERAVSRPDRHAALRATRIIAAFMGAGAALSFIVSVLFVLLGTIIS
jgi:hypothetical protein